MSHDFHVGDIVKWSHYAWAMRMKKNEIVKVWPHENAGLSDNKFTIIALDQNLPEKFQAKVGSDNRETVNDTVIYHTETGAVIFISHLCLRLVKKLKTETVETKKGFPQYIMQNYDTLLVLNSLGEGYIFKDGCKTKVTNSSLSAFEKIITEDEAVNFLTRDVRFPLYLCYNGNNKPDRFSDAAYVVWHDSQDCDSITYEGKKQDRSSSSLRRDLRMVLWNTWVWTNKTTAESLVDQPPVQFPIFYGLVDGSNFFSGAIGIYRTSITESFWIAPNGDRSKRDHSWSADNKYLRDGSWKFFAKEDMLKKFDKTAFNTRYYLHGLGMSKPYLMIKVVYDPIDHKPIVYWIQTDGVERRDVSYSIKDVQDCVDKNIWVELEAAKAETLMLSLKH